MVVQLLAKKKKTRSTCSTGSQTSVDSGMSGDGSSSTPSTTSSPDKAGPAPGSPLQQPVGIVPIGTFEVVTLVQGHSEPYAGLKQTANGSFPPRMSSFKNKKISCQSPSRSISQEKNVQPNKKLFSDNADQIKQMLIQEDPACLELNMAGQNCINPSIMNRLSPFTSPGQSPILSSKSGQDRGNVVAYQQQQFRQQQQQQQQLQLQQQLQQQFSHQIRPPSDIEPIYAEVEVVKGKYPSDKVPAYSMNYNGSPNYNTLYVTDRIDSLTAMNSSASTTSSTDNESLTSSSASCENRLTPRIKPILVKSKSNDSSRTSDKGSSKSVNSVKFANSSPEEIGNPRIMEPINIFPPDHTRSASNHSFFLNVTEKENPDNFKTIKRSPTHRTDENERYTFVTSPAGKTGGGISPKESQLLSTSHSFSSQQFCDSLSDASEAQFSMRSTFSESDTVFEVSSKVQYRENADLHSDNQLSEADQMVLDWLINLKLASYFHNFQSHGFDMISVRAITPEDLNIMDINKAGHRKKLLSEIAKLPPTNKLPRIKPDNVGSWLALLNLQNYEQNFMDGGFDDIDFLKDLDKNDLDMIDIKKKGHQKKILMAVQQLNDLELTAILDEVVADTPRCGLSTSGRSCSDQRLQEFFPPNFSNVNNVSHVAQSYNLYNNDNGSYSNYSSGSSVSDYSPMQRSPLVPIKQTVPPPVGPRTPNRLPLPPKPKPKPKPLLLKSASTGGHYIQSSTESLNEISFLGNQVLNSLGGMQGDQKEIITNSKPRNFFKEQDCKVSSQEGLDRKSSLTSLSSFDCPTNTIKRNSSTAVKPGVKPKPILPNRNIRNPHISPRKPPPPIPPARSDSIRSRSEDSQNDASDESINIKDSDSHTAITTNYICQTPNQNTDMLFSRNKNINDEIPSPLRTTELSDIHQNQSVTKKDSIDEAFGSTDDLLSDLMADIDNFSAQLDAMF